MSISMSDNNFKAHKLKSIQPINGAKKVYIDSKIVRSSSNAESNGVVQVSGQVKLSTIFEKNYTSSEFDIILSSSDESGEGSGNPANKSRTSKSRQYFGPEYDLNLFIQVIKDDFRRTGEKRLKFSAKKGGLLEQFRKVSKEAKANLEFLGFERREGILKGRGGVISKKDVSYGVCTVNVQLEGISHCCLLVNESQGLLKVGNNLNLFVDTSAKYVVNGLDIFIQPNKVVKD